MDASNRRFEVLRSAFDSHIGTNIAPTSNPLFYPKNQSPSNTLISPVADLEIEAQCKIRNNSRLLKLQRWGRYYPSNPKAFKSNATANFCHISESSSDSGIDDDTVGVVPLSISDRRPQQYSLTSDDVVEPTYSANAPLLSNPCSELISTTQDVAIDDGPSLPHGLLMVTTKAQEARNKPEESNNQPAPPTRPADEPLPRRRNASARAGSCTLPPPVDRRTTRSMSRANEALSPCTFSHVTANIAVPTVRTSATPTPLGNDTADDSPAGGCDRNTEFTILEHSIHASPNLPLLRTLPVLPDIKERLAILATAQYRNPPWRAIIDDLRAGGVTNRHKLVDQVLCINKNGLKICLPRELIPYVLYQYHNSIYGLHYAAEKMFQAISATFYFPSMRRDIFDYARSCQKCQRFKSPTTKTGLLSSHALNHVQPFQCLFMDVQHVKRSAINGFKFNIVLVDQFSGFLIAIPLRRITAGAVIMTLQTSFQFHTVPDRIVLDRDPAFNNHEMKLFARQLDIELVFCSPDPFFL